MDRQPSVKLDSLRLPLEPEPKTLTKEQYDLTRAAAVIATMQQSKLPPMKTLEEEPEKSANSEPAEVCVKNEAPQFN